MRLHFFPDGILRSQARICGLPAAEHLSCFWNICRRHLARKIRIIWFCNQGTPANLSGAVCEMCLSFRRKIYYFVIVIVSKKLYIFHFLGITSTQIPRTWWGNVIFETMLTWDECLGVLLSALALVSLQCCSAWMHGDDKDCIELIISHFCWLVVEANEKLVNKDDHLCCANCPLFWSFGNKSLRSRVTCLLFSSLRSVTCIQPQLNWTTECGILCPAEL